MTKHVAVEGCHGLPFISPIEILEQFEDTTSQYLDRTSKEFAGSPLFGDYAAAALRGMCDFEIMRRLYFPALPSINVAQVARQTDKFERDAVLHWGLWKDFIAGGFDVLDRMKRHNETWKTATTVPYPISQTPVGECLLESGTARLYRYEAAPGIPRSKKIPVLLVSPPMNAPAWDLSPEISLPLYLIRQGFDVFLCAWESPTPAQADYSFGDYALEFLPSVIEKVREVTGSRIVNCNGWCLGSALLLACASMRQESRGLGRIIVDTPPIDFSVEGNFFRTWFMRIGLPTLNRVIDLNDGLWPASHVKAGAENLLPYKNGPGRYMTLWNGIDDPHSVHLFRIIESWLDSKSLAMSGAFANDLFYLYTTNALIEGHFKIGQNEYVDLRRINPDTVDMFIMKKDHIVLPKQSLAGEQFGWKSHIGRGGHVFGTLAEDIFVEKCEILSR